MSANLPALQRTVLDLIDEHDQKVAAAQAAVDEFHRAVNAMKMAASVGGGYGGSLWHHSDPTVDVRDVQKFLRISGWKTTYERLNIGRLATANDRRDFERTIQDPPEFTFENAKATFGKYLVSPRFHVLRGLAECFTALDPAYKSHSKVKIGVKGLPKRIILNYWGSYNSWGRDRLKDILNCLRAIQGRQLIENREFEDFVSYWRHKAAPRFAEWSEHMRYRSGSLAERGGVVYQCYGEPRSGGFEIAEGEHRWGTWRALVNSDPGVEIRLYVTTQTCHVIFSPDTLRLINLALAEFYGEVLPDAEDDEPTFKRPGTGLAKDLQYYPTPEAVIDRVLCAAEIEKERYGSNQPAKRILEPSCGDGRILDAITSLGHRCYGIEVHAGRAAEARAKGHPVLTANFLEVRPTADFDAVVMNPPFYGQHWRKHLAHAIGFLEPGGRLVCILPATAHYDHAVEKEFGGEWVDLPVASFAESGTNVPTGFLSLRKPNNQ